MNEQEIKKLIEKLKATKPLKLNLKSSRDNAPRPIHYYNSKKQFIPDIVVTYNDKRDYYIIEKKIDKDDISLLTFKWILFSSEARKTNGDFYLIVDKANLKYCEEVIFEKQLEIELIGL